MRSESTKAFGQPSETKDMRGGRFTGNSGYRLMLRSSARLGAGAIWRWHDFALGTTWGQPCQRSSGAMAPRFMPTRPFGGDSPNCSVRRTLAMRRETEAAILIALELQHNRLTGAARISAALLTPGMSHCVNNARGSGISAIFDISACVRWCLPIPTIHVGRNEGTEWHGKSTNCPQRL
jgi:hypothetical protein